VTDSLLSKSINDEPQQQSLQITATISSAVHSTQRKPNKFRVTTVSYSISVAPSPNVPELSLY